MTNPKAKFDHAAPLRTGVLLINLGTPDSPNRGDVRRYLREFLSDRRVIDLPRWLWLPILHGVILRFRPSRTAALYRTIWSEEGSPLLVLSQAVTRALAAELTTGESAPPPIVELAMRYGKPSVAERLRALQAQQVSRLIVLPMYPQYSATTTATAFDAVAQALAAMKWLPELQFITSYASHPNYLQALEHSVRRHWQAHGQPDRLMMSFHGLPKRYLPAGDPYYCECQRTARELATRLGLDEHQYAVTFQSRVGREPWLTPYTDDTLADWGANGVRHVQVVCPGFAVDCLETLEEIAIGNRELFLKAGGKHFSYVPALNDHSDHVKTLASLLVPRLQLWSDQPAGGDLTARGQRAQMAQAALFPDD